jgi:hypothetical protein
LHRSKVNQDKTNEDIKVSSEVKVNKKPKVGLLFKADVRINKAPLFLVLVHFQSLNRFLHDSELQEYQE